MARPIFVVGSMGSGTTLMRLMLDSHPNIMIAKETGFMRSVSAITSVPFWNARENWIKRIGLTTPELDRSIERFYDEVFGLAASKQGATRWGDKTPFHVEFIGAAARVFPEALFVGTVRHPGGVANSVGRFGWNWRKGVRHWCSANESLVDSGTAVAERLRLWRYEDLVSSPEPVMREVLDFVDEPWDPTVLEHHQHQSGRAEGGTVADDPVDTNRIAKWAAAASPKQLNLLHDMAGPLADFFGYDTGQSLPVKPIAGTAEGRLGAGAESWSEHADVISAIPRHRAGGSFENSMYKQKDLAVELGSAYEKGVTGGRIRRPYADMLPESRGGNRPDDAPKQQPAAPTAPAAPAAPITPTTFVSKVRRRFAHIVSPDT